MSKQATRSRTGRLVGVIAAAGAALMAVGLVVAPAAGASVDSVTPTSATGPVGGTAVFTVTPSANDTLIAAITSTTVAGTADTVACTGSKGAAYTCTVTNKGGSGTDTITFTSQKQTCILILCGPVTDDGTATATATFVSVASVAVAPKTANIAPGGQQNFTATVTGTDTKPASGVDLTFSATGPGQFGGATSTTATTGSDGTAVATLAVPAGAQDGTGTVTVSAGDKNDSATYTVKTVPTEKPVLTLASPSAGHLVATVHTAPAISGAVVHLYTLNGNGAIKAYVAHAKANGSGVATHTFTAVKPGATYTMVAKVFGNDDYAQQFSAPASKTVAEQQVSKVTLAVASASAHHIHSVMKIGPAIGGVAVHLYTVSLEGVLKQVAVVRTNSQGMAHDTITSAKSGKTYYFVAGVLTSTGSVQAASQVESVVVK